MKYALLYSTHKFFPLFISHSIDCWWNCIAVAVYKCTCAFHTQKKHIYNTITLKESRNERIWKKTKKTKPCTANIFRIIFSYCYTNWTKIKKNTIDKFIILYYIIITKLWLVVGVKFWFASIFFAFPIVIVVAVNVFRLINFIRFQ